MEKRREGEGEGEGAGLRSTTKEKKWSLNSIQRRKRMKPRTRKAKQGGEIYENTDNGGHALTKAAGMHVKN